MSDLETDIWDRDYEEYSSEYSQVPELDDEVDSDLYEEEEVEQIVSDMTEDLYEEQSLMDNARIRLEQGRLYEMLIKHNLFEGVDAAPEAIQKVQKEIKEFIMERLEILLGIRAEKEKQIIVQSDSFNDVEIEALKMVASKVTKGVSTQQTNNTTPKQPASELNTIKKTSQASKINALGKKTSSDAVKKNSLNNKPQKKIRKIKKAMTQTGTKNMTVDEIAKRDIKYIESLKKVPLSEANKIVSQRHNRPRPKISIDQEAVNAHYRTRMATNEMANTFTALLAMAKKK